MTEVLLEMLRPQDHHMTKVLWEWLRPLDHYVS